MCCKYIDIEQKKQMPKQPKNIKKSLEEFILFKDILFGIIDNKYVMLSNENQVCSCHNQPDLEIDKEYFCSHINILIQRREDGIKQQLTDIYSPGLLEKISKQLIMDILFSYMAEEDSFNVKKFIIMIKSYHKLLSDPEIKPLIKILEEIKDIISTIEKDPNRKNIKKQSIDDLKVLDQQLAKVFSKNTDMHLIIEYEAIHYIEMFKNCRLDYNLEQTIVVIEVVKLMGEIKDCAKEYSFLNDRDTVHCMDDDEIDSAIDAECEHETELDNKLVELISRCDNYMHEDILATLDNLNCDPVFIHQGISLFNTSISFLRDSKEI